MKNINQQFTIEKTDRIDTAISKYLTISRAFAIKLIEQGHVYEGDEKILKKSCKALEGSTITIKDFVYADSEILPEEISLDIVYEDEHLVIINKPSGMVVHPAPGHVSKTLVNALLYKYPSIKNVGSETRPGIVHRIDKDTSGLIIVAKTQDAYSAISKMIEKHKIKRVYWAIVKGKVDKKIIHIDLPIGRDVNNRKKMKVTQNNSKDSITHIYLKAHKGDLSLVECQLETGRTHQIRVHLSYIKHPVYGDPVYGVRIDDFNQRLHAIKLEFTHPITNEEISVESDVPSEFVFTKEDFRPKF